MNCIRCGRPTNNGKNICELCLDYLISIATPTEVIALARHSMSCAEEQKGFFALVLASTSDTVLKDHSTPFKLELRRLFERMGIAYEA